MTEKEKTRLVEIGQRLSTLGVEFRVAQMGLEKMVDEHGMSSPEAVEASGICSRLALCFAEAEEEFISILTKEAAMG
ncbi:MAG: hypothetical protein HFF44_03150 [Lawsonibacter sp.]|nr:hypothetical protein [Lawsonibacter sp.]